MEASNRLKQAHHFSTHRKVQTETPESIRTSLLPGEWVSSINLSHSYLHTKLKEILKVLHQIRCSSSPPPFSFNLATAPPTHPPTPHPTPPGLYNDCERSEADGALQRTQTSPIPGRLADQVPVSGGSPSEHSGGGKPNPVLGLDHKSGKVRTETYSGVFVRGLRIPSRFSPCKTHLREMAQTPGFDPTTRINTYFDCKMFDVANWVACLNGENGPGGTPSHEALSVSSQGALEISSVAGQPPSLDRNHCCTPRMVAESHNPTNVMRGADLHPKTTGSNSLQTPHTKVGALT